MEKTAMMQLYNELENFEQISKDVSISDIKRMIGNYYVEKEKKQLISFGYSQIQYIDAEIGDLVYNKVPEEIYRDIFGDNIG